MSYSKSTIISGHKAGYTPPTAPVGSAERGWQVAANSEFFVVTVRPGHWRPENAVATARRMGIVGRLEVTHMTSDFSGKGRGGYDRKWIGDEGGVHEVGLSEAERDYNDAEDVHAVCDEIDTQ